MRHLNHLLVALLACSWAPAAQGQATGPSPADKFPLPLPDPSSAEPDLAAVARGSLAVQAIQGTPGGPAIGAAKVEVQLVHRGMLVDTLEAMLDEHGVVMIEDLPVGMGVQPIVQVHYAGVTYQQAGAMMDTAHREQKVRVLCYEVTDEAPDWKVTMRHVMLSRAPEGLRVTELLRLENPADRTWLGTPAADGSRTTTVLTLPQGAQDVSLGRGFHDWCCSTLADGRLINHLPLMPETTELNFSYIIQPEEGSVAIDVVAPASVDSMMVIVPEDMTMEAVQGLEAGGTQTMGSTTVRYYVAGGLAAGEVASLSVSGLAAAEAATTVAESTTDTAESSNLAKIIAAIGGAVLLLLAIIIIFFRSPKPALET